MSNDELARSTFAQQRQDQVLHLIRARGSIVVSEVAPELGVSELTIRRDVNQLARRGLVKRVHGGATLPDPEATFSGAPRNRGGRTIGMVVPSYSYYWPSIIAGARAAAATAGVRLLLRTSSYDLADDRRQLRNLLQTPGLQGLILAPDVSAPDSPELLAELDALDLPVVLTERTAPPGASADSLEWASSDHAAGAGMAVRHLHDQGHRRIGLLYPQNSPTSRQLIDGWRDELRRLGEDPALPLTGISDGFLEAGRDTALDRTLEAVDATGTTALLIHADAAAVAFVQHCTDQGLHVGDDLAVVAYDDEVAALGSPPVSAIRPPKEYVGRLTVELLLARLNEGSQRPVHRVRIGPELHVRESSVRC
ncbi:substrate-binding domain-containing protein [Naumannella halotolerans]|uniref:substrate-binding domain-containing protein n=1 Tax=Naumannella halotolerans TaxID=993414 RepID=UPI00370D3962